MIGTTLPYHTIQSKLGHSDDHSLSSLWFLSSPIHLFLLLFNGSGNASWTYSCEYFRYPTIPSLTWIWRELLEPGIAPTTPDDWPSARAKSITRVSIFTSTACEAERIKAVTSSFCMCIRRHMAYVLHIHTPKYLICRQGEQIYVSVYTQGACKAASTYPGAVQKIQMFCFAQH